MLRADNFVILRRKPVKVIKNNSTILIILIFNIIFSILRTMILAF